MSRIFILRAFFTATSSDFTIGSGPSGVADLPSGDYTAPACNG